MLRALHLDFHILLTLLQRGWNIVAGGITVIFMPVWLTAEEQGYYFTFLSLLALQVFFELGFNSVIVQLVGHEVAHLKADEFGMLDGDALRVLRLKSLLTLLRRWYLIAAVAFSAVVSVAGFFFFRAKGGLPVGSWLGVWIALVFFTSINLYLSPQLAVFEGVGRVGHVARLRLIQSMIGYCLMWSALSFGAGLKAVVISTGISAISSILWLISRKPFLTPSQASTVPEVHRMSWRTEIFPFQWRIAVSWISGYFIFQAFTPLVFAHQGAVEAGRLGIALSIFSSISVLGMSWVNASAPKMAQYIARGERAPLNSMFIIVLRSAVIFTLLASVAFLLFVQILGQFHYGLAVRIASLPVLSCLAFAAVVNSFISAAAIYMRAHKVEPMLLPSIVGGVLCLLAAYFGSQVGVRLTVALYASITALVGLPWTIHLFLPYFRREA